MGDASGGESGGNSSEQPGDKVLLCSDGVFNALGEEALAAALAGDPYIAAQRLEEEILAQAIPGQDNFTGVILECAAGM